jgi:flavin reductase (DIM6/NTAB) family NADH-FMN oxidoreductase RutF
MNDRSDDRYAVAREALAQLAMPVAIIGAQHDGRRSCATGTAMYVSFAPPRLAIAQHPGSQTTALIEASGRFSVSLLRDDQLQAALDAGHGARTHDKFAELGLEVLERPDTAPAVAGSASVLWCDVVSTSDAGDHRLYIGEVVAYELGETQNPLIRHRRRYAALGEALSEVAPEGYPT